MRDKHSIVVTCFPRISDILEEELLALGYNILYKDKTNIRINGDWNDIMKLNLKLRSANRVLWEIASFNVVTPDQLYEAVKKIKWHTLIPKNGYFSIQSYVKNDYIKDTRFANLKVKDAIVDYHYDLFGSRPDSGSDLSKTVIYLHWINNKASLYFDTSGESLSKHGYRKDPWKAPMNESLAAATILKTDWNPETGNFINPMCGSGTLAIEAAMIAANIPAGWNRKNFGFMHIIGFNQLQWSKVRTEAKSKFTSPKIEIIATDLHPKAIEIAKKNATLAGVDKYISFSICDFRDTPVPGNGGVVFLNPEYGERLGEEKGLSLIYKAIGDFFKQKCNGYTGYIFTGNLKLAKVVGLKPNRKYEFLNAKIDSRLIEYELYQGKK